MKPQLIGRERLWAIAQDAACQAGFDRWLLLAVAANLALRLVLPRLQYFDDLNLWTFGIGLAGGGAGLLGCWIALGGGRVALRVLIAVVCGWLSVLLHAAAVADDESSRGIHAAAELFAMTLSTAAAGVLRGAFKFMLVQTIYVDSNASCSAGPRWQFRLADLFWWVLVAGILLFHRSNLGNFAAVFYVVGQADAYNILYAIRCGAFGFAVTAILGVPFLLGTRLRIALMLMTSLAAIGTTMLAGLVLDSESPWQTLGIFGSAGIGGLIAVLATLLPLRMTGWRLERMMVSGVLA